MKPPPRALIEKMLADGPLGAFVSSICLMSAHLVKRGLPIEAVDKVDLKDPITNEEPSAADMNFYRERMRDVYRDLSAGPASGVDHAIALYTAHLKAAGYNVEVFNGDN